MDSNSPSAHISVPTTTMNSSADTGPVVQDELVSSTTSTAATIATTVVEESSSGATKISFSVTRRETNRVTRCITLGVRRDHQNWEDDDEGGEKEDEHRAKKRGVLSLEDGVIIDAEKPRAKREKKLFVIPVLRLSSRAQITRLKKLVDEGTATEADQARLSLLLDSLEDEESEEKIASLSLDSSYRQTVPTVAVADDDDPDYASVPVEEFGLAFLRGCGWKDAQSCIGKSNPQAVSLRVSAPRPKGLGLGAVLPSTGPPPSASTQKTDENGAGDEEKPLGKHSYIKCLAGLNKGSYGQVTSMDEENASVFVELAWPSGDAGKMVRISQWAVKVVRRKEFNEWVKGCGVGVDGVTAENGRRRERIRV
uniref:G-patch_2 domain-containing protein n=1 Tax=Globodera pallida TaxID=36090 RepID=A0A183BJR2_GLOPA